MTKKITQLPRKRTGGKAKTLMKANTPLPPAGIESSGHLEGDDRQPPAAAGRPRIAPMPIRDVGAPSSSGAQASGRRHVGSETLNPHAAATSNDGHFRFAPQVKHVVVADPAVLPSRPIPKAQDRPSIRGKRKQAAASPAIPATTPTKALRDWQPSGGASRRRPGHQRVDAQIKDAGADNLSGGHFAVGNHPADAAAGDDLAHNPLGTRGGPSPIIAEIVSLWRMRQRWHRAEKALVLQAKAICRGHTQGDKGAANKLFDAIEAGESVSPELAWALAPFMSAIKRFRKGEADATVFELRGREHIEKRLEQLVVGIRPRKDDPGTPALPIWPAWAEGVRGLGPLSVAAIVGEAGDLAQYSNPSKLWKRMGLAVVCGERQRRKSDAEDALLHGYNPARRSVIWNIGGALIGGMGRGPRPRVSEDIEARADWAPYQKMFVRFLRQEVAKVSETWNGPDHAREPVERNGELFESFSAHAANRAKRRVEKQFLVDLWSAWKRAAGCSANDTPRSRVGGPSHFAEAAE